MWAERDSRLAAWPPNRYLLWTQARQSMAHEHTRSGRPTFSFQASVDLPVDVPDAVQAEGAREHEDRSGI